MFLFVVTVLGLMIHKIEGECGPPPIIENTANNATLAATFPESTIIRYRCGFLFDRYGWPIFTCADGEWTNGNRTFRCVWKSCSPPAIDNGNYRVQSFTVGNMIHFSCNHGYSLIGNPVSVCRTNRRWREIPTCQLVHCPSLPDRRKLNRFRDFNSDPDGYDSVVWNSCDPGFMLHGSERQSCQGNGTWSGIDAYCEEIDCGYPDVGDGYAEDLDGDTGYLAHAIVTCNEGSKLTGTDVIMCTEDGWEPAYCNSRCPAPGMILHGSALTSDLSHGDVLQWQCNVVGYMKSSGTENVTCNDGQLVPQPACVPIEFGDVACPNETKSTRTARYGNTCYMFRSFTQTYENAVLTCGRQGGSMLMVKSKNVMDFIESALSTITWYSDASPWLGMKYIDSADRWVWNDDWYVTYANWKPGEGGASWLGKFEKCTVLVYTEEGWMWDDTDCDDIHYVICQTEARA